MTTKTKSIYDRLDLLETDPDDAGQDIEKTDIMDKIHTLEDKIFGILERVKELQTLPETSKELEAIHLKLLEIQEELY